MQNSFCVGVVTDTEHTAKGATRGLRGLKPPSPLSQIKVEKEMKF